MIMYLQLNMQLYGYAKGSVLKLKCDNSGIPLEKKWRKITKTSKIDNKTSILAIK